MREGENRNRDGKIGKYEMHKNFQIVILADYTNEDNMNKLIDNIPKF